MKKALVLLSALLMSLTLCACHEHNWLDANCTDPMVCSSCGEINGVAKGHAWKEATCTESRTCSACGKTEGFAKGHSWKSATCTVPKTCTTCKKTEGSAKGHSWNEATCTTAKTCSSCGVTEGSPSSNHNWKNATCTTAKTCSTCGATEGSPKGHTWESATCTTPKTCSACGETEGSAIGHSWETVNVYTKQCTTCSATEIDQSKLPVKLGSLKPCTGGDYHSTNIKNDIYGNIFSEGLQFFVARSGSYKQNVTEYVLNKEYKNFTAKVLIDRDSTDFFESNLKIYVDGVLKYDSKPLNKKTQPINLEIDISNATFLKIETNGITSNGRIMIADPMLHY